MSRLLVVGDLHISNKTPSSRLDEDYLETCRGKLQQVVTLSQNVDATLLTGDLFNSPNPPYTVLIMFLTDFLSQFTSPVFTILGNHDVFSRSLKTLTRTAAYLLREVGQLRIISPLTENPIQLSDSCIYVGKETKDHYHGTKIEMIHELLTERLEFIGTIPVEEYHTEADIVISGHYHPGFEKWVGPVFFLNPGSLLRTNVGEKDRQPKVAILDTKTTEVTLVDIKTTGSEIFREMSSPGDSIMDSEGLRRCLRLFAQEQEKFSVDQLVREVGREHKFDDSCIQEVLKRLHAEY